MREILFRGQRADNDEWVYGYLVRMWGALHIIDKDDENVAYEIKPETVGQFTGLHDKNGTKIFEGDIVDILTENEELGKIEYNDGGFWVEADGFCLNFMENINGEDVEVIGNIYDNPELIEVE